MMDYWCVPKRYNERTMNRFEATATSKMNQFQCNHKYNPNDNKNQTNPRSKIRIK